MKKVRYIFAALVLSVVMTSCSRQEDSMYCNITLNAECEDAEFVSIKIDNTVKGNFFRNLNTGMEYEYPIFVNGKCTFRILKGVYVFAFDGIGTTADGTGHKVRCYSHRSPNESVNLLDDRQEITFDLMML